MYFDAYGEHMMIKIILVYWQLFNISFGEAGIPKHSDISAIIR